MTRAALVPAMLLAAPAHGQQQQTPKPQSILPPAMQTPPPAATTSTPPQNTPVPPPVVQTLPAAPLPRLSAEQAAQITTMLNQGRITQGLRYAAADARETATDSDTLVRAALDYARAVHSGRLDSADFIEDWGLRPVA
ncbi:hypothetical protein [Sphingomonas sp.]|uniref:hypothetical protein n=1 Tax=Sphingomonas sp. TaxID=28214 RepID=UPI0039C91AB6